MVAPTVVFFHAHPDDEAIFTGGTIARLSQDGARVVVVLATSGELGAAVSSAESHDAPSLSSIRVAEAQESCAILGVDKLLFLDYADSGIGVDLTPKDAFAVANIYVAAEQLAQILRTEQADVLVHYDEDGIYGHSDHLAVHRVGKRAAKLAETATVYEATVDHEHLHFVETHLVGHAIASLHESAVAGLPTAMVSTTIDVTSVISKKREAMAAHSSQIGPYSEVMAFSPDSFMAVYGHEWFVRYGPRTALDELSM